MAGFVVRNRFNRNQGGPASGGGGDWLRSSRGVGPTQQIAGGEGPQRPDIPLQMTPADTRLGPTALQTLIMWGGQEVASSVPGVRAIKANSNTYFFNSTGDLVGTTYANNGNPGGTAAGGGGPSVPASGGQPTAPSGGAPSGGSPSGGQPAAPTGTGTPGTGGLTSLPATSTEGGLTISAEQLAAINGDPLLQPLISQLINMEAGGQASLSQGEVGGQSPEATPALEMQPNLDPLAGGGPTGTAELTQGEVGAPPPQGTPALEMQQSQSMYSDPTAPAAPSNAPALFADASGNMVTLEQLMAQSFPVGQSSGTAQFDPGPVDMFQPPSVDTGNGTYTGTPSGSTAVLDPGFLTTPMEAQDYGLYTPPSGGASFTE